jgi:hypothetical protein
LTLLLVPWLALALELVYPRFLVIEHLLLSMVLHAQGLLIFGALLVVGHPLGVLFGAGWMSMMLYRGLRGVYGQTHARTAWKWALAVGIYVAGWLCAMAGSFITIGSA